MQIDDLARITQEQFAAVDEQLGQLKVGQQKLEIGMQKLEQKMDAKLHQVDAKLQLVLDVVLEIPAKKVVEKLTHTLEDHDDRVLVVEKKLRTVSP